MAIEKNVIFLYPLAQVLQELKKELEENEDFTVYELDSVDEYSQLIGVMEQSVTFSSDMKKTTAYLESCKQFVKTKTSKNYLVHNEVLSPLSFSRLQRNGLDEGVSADANLKNLTHKVNLFFTTIEKEQKKIEEEKNKAIPENFSSSTTIGAKKNDNEKINTNEVLRVEKMATFDEEKPELKLKKSKYSFDLNTMLGGGSSFKLTRNPDRNNPFLKSPFDSLQLKKVKTFNPVDLPSKGRRASFKEVEQEYGRNPHKSLDLKNPGELNRKKTSSHDFSGGDHKRKKYNFEEIERELNTKKINFSEVDKELNRKKIDFEQVHKDLNKKRALFVQQDQSSKKRKLFEQVERELNKKKIIIDQIDDELKKKNNNFEEVEKEFNKKKQQFDELADDNAKKAALNLELEDLQKKRHKLLDDIDLGLKKKKEFIELELDSKEIKKLNLDAFEEEKTGSDEELDSDDDYKKKKNGTFEEVELSKKKKSFIEIEQDKDSKKNKFNEIELEKKKENNDFNEIEIGSKKKNGTFESEHNEKKKGKTFNEVKKDVNKRDKNELAEKLSHFTIGDESEVSSKKEFEEQTLDYSKFKKNKRTGEFYDEESEEDKLEKKRLDSILGEPEYNYFDNESYGIEYLVYFNDFLFKDTLENENLFKFIHFALIKEYDADISFYLADSQSTDAPTKNLYSGHIKRQNKVLDCDYAEFEKENFPLWLKAKLPTWKDETYQIEINEFIYPFFEEGELLGLAVCHFNQTIKNHDDAHKVELLIMSLKGAILEECTIGGS